MRIALSPLCGLYGRRCKLRWSHELLNKGTAGSLPCVSTAACTSGGAAAYRGGVLLWGLEP